MYQHNFSTVPAQDNDIYINPGRGFFSIVRPLNTKIINYVANSSFENGLSDYWANYYADNNAVIAPTFVTTDNYDNAYHGAFSLQVNQVTSGLPYGVEYFPSNFVDAPLIPIDSGKNIYIAVYVKACAGDTIQLRGTFDGVLAPTNPDFISRTTETIATGDWQRVSVYVTNMRPAPSTVWVGFIARVLPAPGSPCNNFLIDAATATDVQINDYFDGDTEGAIWASTPYFSYSILPKTARGFGEEIFLNDIGFDLISYSGAGMMPVVNDTLPYAQGGGSYYNRTWPSPVRTITLVGTINSRYGLKDLKKKHSKLIELVGLFRFFVDPQPFILRYRMTKCDWDDSGILEIPVVYKSGLEGSISNTNTEKITLQLDAYEEQFWRSPRVLSRLLVNNGTVNICYRGTAPTPIYVRIKGQTVSENTIQLVNVKNTSLGSGIYMQNSPNVGFQTVGNPDQLMIGDINKISGKAIMLNRSTGVLTNLSGNILRPSSTPSEFVLLHGDNEIEINFNDQAGIIPRVFVSYRERFLSGSDAWRLPTVKQSGQTFDPTIFNDNDRCR